MRLTKTLTLGLTLALGASAFAQTNYSNCPITGKFASYSINPAVAGQLTVQTNLPGPGFYNGNNPSKIKDGFEYCLAANLAHRLGIKKLVIQNTGWDAMVAGQTKRFDLAFSQISITPERKKVVNFSKSYFESDIGVLVRSEDTFAATDLVNKRIGVQQGTTADTFVSKTLKPKTAARVYPDVAAGFTALMAGQIDTFMVDTAIVLAKASESKGKLAVIGQFKTGDQYGALVPKTSKNLPIFNKAIAAMIKDGTVGTLATKYLGGDPTAIAVWKP